MKSGALHTQSAGHLSGSIHLRLKLFQTLAFASLVLLGTGSLNPGKNIHITKVNYLQLDRVYFSSEAGELKVLK